MPAFRLTTLLLGSLLLVGMFNINFAAESSVSVLIPAREVACKLPVGDVSGEVDRQSIIARGTKAIYQGHPHTLLLPDGKTILAAWTLNHGGACGPLAKSTDGGRTWSGLLPVPADWATIKNCPTLHRITGPDGVTRLLVFAGNGAMYQSTSFDDGQTFSPMQPNGLKCIVAPISIEAVEWGKKWLMWYHRGSSDELVNEHKDKSPKAVWQSASTDGGQTWGDSHVVCELAGGFPCEPAVIKSPDGKQLLMFIRENTRKWNSLFIVSNDDGATWSPPNELPAALTGDRHLARYSSDGRLVVVFRDQSKSSTKGHFVAWVGHYADIIEGRDGDYRVKLLHHTGRPGDTGYPGLERLVDDTFVATTYVQLAPEEKNSVVAVRFRLGEMDEKIRGKK